MWKDLSELVDSLWILMSHIISLQKIFLAEKPLNNYVNTMTHYMNIKQLLSIATSPCLLNRFTNKEFITARRQVKTWIQQCGLFDTANAEYPSCQPHRQMLTLSQFTIH